MQKLFIIDTETTGLDPSIHSVWQLAGYYRNSQGNWFSLNLKCCPLRLELVTEEALTVCHTTKEELSSYMPAKDLYEQFRNFLVRETIDGDKITWIGYNSKFDIQFVEKLFKDFDPNDSIFKFFSRQTVDMYEFMKILKSMELINTPSLKLEEAYKMFGIGTETAHDALQDVMVTSMLYQWAEGIMRKGLT